MVTLFGLRTLFLCLGRTFCLGFAVITTAEARGPPWARVGLQHPVLGDHTTCVIAHICIGGALRTGSSGQRLQGQKL